MHHKDMFETQHPEPAPKGRPSFWICPDRHVQNGFRAHILAVFRLFTCQRASDIVRMIHRSTRSIGILRAFPTKYSPSGEAKS